MHSFLEEFKKFAMRGNVIDLAVGIVIGAAFGKIVSSLVQNVVMPTIGIIMGGIDFTNLSFMVRNAEITYGVFIQSVIDFVIIALVIFLAIKGLNALKKKEEAKEEEKPKEPSEEVKLLREIRDKLKTK
jgi:large conductance mechanosensitive channel